MKETNEVTRSFSCSRELAEKLDRLVPAGRRSAFIRDALEAALVPLDLAARVRALEEERG